MRKDRHLRNSTRILVALTLAAVGIFAVTAAFADFSAKDWQYVKQIRLPAGLQEETLLELSPDAEVFDHASSGLQDLRIISDDGLEVPYKLEVMRGQHERESFSASLRDLGYVPGEHTTFVVDLGLQGIIHNEVEIVTPSENFRRTVTVEASNDSSTWAEMAEDEIYDFTVQGRSFNTSNTLIRYTDSTARYLRVTIADDGEGAIAVSSVNVFLTRETLPQEVSWPISSISTTRDSQERTTIVTLDMGNAGIPTQRIQLDTPDVNFYRQVSLETSADSEVWRTIASGATIWSYQTPTFQGSNAAITYSEADQRYFRLTIQDGDNAPLTVQDAEVWGIQRRIVFSANPERDYKLYYGNTEARRPSYDIEQVFPYLSTEDLQQAFLEAEATNAEYEIPVPPLSERLPWLFPIAVGVAAVVIGFILYSVLRQARKLLPPEA